MSKMKKLNLKLKDFQRITTELKDLYICLQNLEYDYPFQHETQQKITNISITKLKKRIFNIKNNLPTFSREEYNIFPIKDKHSILKLKVCPFCKGDIKILKTETYCLKCGFLFREGE